MSSFLTLKKKKKVVEEVKNTSIKIEDLLPKDTSFIIPEIDIAFLDKEYAMKDFKECAEKSLLKRDKLNIDPKFIGIAEDAIGIEIKTPNSFFKKEKKIKRDKTHEDNEHKQVQEIVEKRDKSGLNLDAKANLKNITTKLENLGITKENGLINTFVINESLQVKFNSTNSSQSNCWWCKHTIPKHYKPLGCPIKYIKGINEDFFESDGWFCCFNCIIAYINEVSLYQIRYRESTLLVYLLYYKIFNKHIKPGIIKPSPDWRLLKTFGGNLSIDEFRSMIQTNELSLNWISQTTQSDPNESFKLINNSLNYIEEVSKKIN